MLKNELLSLSNSPNEQTSKKYRQETLRKIVLEYLREVAAQGFTKVKLEKGDIIHAILYNNQTILDEIRSGGVYAMFDYECELVLNWSE